MNSALRAGTDDSLTTGASGGRSCIVGSRLGSQPRVRPRWNFHWRAVSLFASVMLGICLRTFASGSELNERPGPPSQPTIAGSRQRVVLLTIDGVRWQEIFFGVDAKLGKRLSGELSRVHSARELMPNLYELADERGILVGSNAAPLRATSGNTLSLPGYLELFSGRSSTCADNDCAATDSPTVVDEWVTRDPTNTLAVFSSWPNIARAAAKDLSKVTLSTGRTVQANSDNLCDYPRLCETYRSGLRLRAWPGLGGYRPDYATVALAFEYLRSKQPHLLFLGLGDTDEYAHRGDYEGYLRALRAADETLGALRTWLQEQEAHGYRTLLICTTDHGRERGFSHHGGAPEAARIWALFAGSVVKARGIMVAPPARLADIAPTIREFVTLPADTRPGAGQSLLPLLTAPRVNEEQPRVSL